MKKILSLVLALAMVLSLCACNNTGDTETSNPPADNSEPADNTETPEVPVEPGEFQPLTYEDETIYMGAFEEFYNLYSDALEIENVSERIAAMAIAEAKLLEAGVMFPLSSNGGNYSMGRLATRTAPTVMWGNDEYRYHNAVVTTEIISADVYPVLAEKWSELRGTGEYEGWVREYLTEQGYELKDSFTRFYTGDPNTWDVLNSYYQSDSEPLVNTYDGLMEYNMENELVPALAESYEVSEDGLTYTFHIREGAVWTDSQGREIGKITAQDWVDGLQHLLDAQGGLEELVAGVIVNASEYITQDITDFSQVGVKAVDEYTLEYTLTSPRSYFMTMMGYGIFAPLCRSYYESLGGAFGVAEYQEAAETCTYGTSPDTIAYCGPYLITNATKENTIVFKANPSYWNADNITLKTITWLYNDDSDAVRAYNDVISGAVDSAGQNTSCTEKAKTEGTFDQYYRVSSPDATSFVGFFNLNRQMFANYNDPTVCVSTQSHASADEIDRDNGVYTSDIEDDTARTHVALNNQHFRLALAYAMDRAQHNAQIVGEDLKYMSLINAYVPATFIATEEDITVDINGTATSFPAGTWYGEIRQAQIDADGYPFQTYDPDGEDGAGSGAGFDGWYNVANAKDEMTKAVAELAAQGLEITAENPIQIDVVYAGASSAYTNRAQVLKQSIEAAHDGLVQVNLVEAAGFPEWQDAVYYYGNGDEGNFDLNDFTGWGPDFGDPSTYLDTLLPYGDGSMSKNFGLW